MNEHSEGCKCSMCTLQALDKGTEWELPREVSDTGSEDDSMATMSDDKFPTEELDSIISLLVDWAEDGKLKELIVIVGDTNDDQYMFTNLDRNDAIVGQLGIAQMNWMDMQVKIQRERE